MLVKLTSEQEEKVLYKVKRELKMSRTAVLNKWIAGTYILGVAKTSLIQSKALNLITLGNTKTDYINQMIALPRYFLLEVFIKWDA